MDVLKLLEQQHFCFSCVAERFLQNGAMCKQSVQNDSFEIGEERARQHQMMERWTMHALHEFYLKMK